MSEHQINEILEKLSKVAGHCDLVTVKNLGCGPEVGSIEIVEGSTTRVYQLDTEGYVQHKTVRNGYINKNYVLVSLDGYWVKDVLSRMGEIYFLEWRPVVGFVQVFDGSSMACNYTIRDGKVSYMEVVRSRKSGGIRDGLCV